MRTFEIALIMMNVLSLALVVRKPPAAGAWPRGVWLVAAGAGLFLFAVHAAGEGPRWQMLCSYVFSGAFAVYALVQTAHRGGSRPIRRSRPGRALKILLTGLAGLTLAGTALLAWAFPVFSLPKPSGEYAVGVQYFHLVDEQRADPFLDSSHQRRELMVKVYYPAAVDGSKPYMTYFHGSSELIDRFTAFYHLPGFVFDHLRLVRTHAKEGLPLADRLPRYPVILFSHGAGTTLEVQTAQSEDLASHGYVVAAIDHTYVSAATIFPDRVVTHHQATTSFETPEPAEIITQIMAQDASFVIDSLGRMNAGALPSPFKGRLNLNQIGAIGHSVGGAAAYNLANHDPRIKAAINLDGAVYITPNPDSASIAPLLMLAGDTYHVQSIQKREPLLQPLAGMTEIDREITRAIYGSEAAYQLAYEKARQNVSGLADVLGASGTLYTIQGSDHMKYTDIGLLIGLRPLRELLNIHGETDPLRCLEIASAVSVSFFDHYLKGVPSVSMEALQIWYPELHRVEITQDAR